MKASRSDKMQTSSSYPGVFAFEIDFGGTLRCIPMSVRMKLDQTGIKLTLKQWNKLPPTERRQLIERHCDDHNETESYKEFLISFVRKYTKTSVELAPIDKASPWTNRTAVPERICNWAHNLGIAPPSTKQWAVLTPLQRFTLFKLTRPGHSNDNFLPAMREFSIFP
ncbi:MAG: nitrate reductase associated protein [Steroidobacteraceae bacterium]